MGSNELWEKIVNNSGSMWDETVMACKVKRGIFVEGLRLSLKSSARTAVPRPKF